MDRKLCLFGLREHQFRLPVVSISVAISSAARYGKRMQYMCQSLIEQDTSSMQDATYDHTIRPGPSRRNKFNIVPVRGADSEGVGRLSVGANLDRMLGCGRAGHREP